MAKLKQWLREWLGFNEYERAAVYEYDIAAKERKAIESRMLSIERELERLRPLILSTPDAPKQVLRPKTWAETMQIMGRF